MLTKSFIWNDIMNWRSDIEEMIPQEICNDFIEDIRNHRDNFKYFDEIDIFMERYSKFGDYSVLEDNFANNFPLKFPFVRMYHCCRPADISSYYSKGITVLDFDEANERFRKLFNRNPSFPKVTEFHIEQAISFMSAQYLRRGTIYFGLDDRFLTTYCSHYLISGSEYIQGLAAFLSRELNCNAKAELIKTGKPTIFEVDMPIKEIRHEDIRALADDIFPAWAFVIAHDKSETGKVDFSIEINHVLKPEFIIGHFHPNMADN